MIQSRRKDTLLRIAIKMTRPRMPRNKVTLIRKKKGSPSGRVEYYGDCLTFGRVWRGSSTLGELIVASPARRQRPGHPRLSHLSSSYLPRATPAGFGIGRDSGNALTTTGDVVQACPIARQLPGGAAFPHGPFCDRGESEREMIIRCRCGKKKGMAAPRTIQHHAIVDSR